MMLRPTACAPRTSSPSSRSKRAARTNTKWIRRPALCASTHYPANYGFLPRTWADDGDPLDVLVLCSECIRPLSLVECYPIGVITMEDGGSLDEKIIAIPFQDPTYNTYQDISELPDHVASEIKHFFRVYKSLEGKETVVSDVLGRDEAVKIIIKCQNAYIEKYCR